MKWAAALEGGLVGGMDALESQAQDAAFEPPLIQ